VFHSLVTQPLILCALAEHPKVLSALLLGTDKIDTKIPHYLKDTSEKITI